MGIVTKKEPKGYCLLIYLYTKKVIKGSEKNSNCMLQHMMLVNEDYNCFPLKATVAQKIKIISVFLLVLVQRLSWESFSLSLAAQQGWQPNMATSAIPVHLFSTLSRRDMATSRKDTCILKSKILVSFVVHCIGWSPPPSIPPHFALGNFDFVTFLAANQSHCVGLSNFRSSTLAASIERHVNQASSELPVDKAIFSTKSA